MILHGRGTLAILANTVGPKIMYSEDYVIKYSHEQDLFNSLRLRWLLFFFTTRRFHNLDENSSHH